MTSTTLTAAHVAALAIRDRPYCVYDPQTPGFGVRIAPGGTRSWIVEYRPNGGGRKQASRRLTIGRVGPLSLAKARDRARTVLAQVRLGGDPAAQLAGQRSAATVPELAALYLQKA